jgi:hypothetical protein
MVIPVSPTFPRSPAEQQQIGAARLYRRAHERMTKRLGCGNWDWRTLYVVSPTWYATLQALWSDVR